MDETNETNQHQCEGPHLQHLHQRVDPYPLQIKLNRIE